MFKPYLMPLINEAAFILMEGIASAEDIDAVLKPVSAYAGPLAMGDYIGLDVLLAIMETQRTWEKVPSCPLLSWYVQAIRAKSGKRRFRLSMRAIRDEIIIKRTNIAKKGGNQMIAGQEYRESLRRLKPNIYIMGEKMGVW